MADRLRITVPAVTINADGSKTEKRVRIDAQTIDRALKTLYKKLVKNQSNVSIWRSSQGVNELLNTVLAAKGITPFARQVIAARLAELGDARIPVVFKTHDSMIAAGSPKVAELNRATRTDKPTNYSLTGRAWLEARVRAINTILLGLINEGIQVINVVDERPVASTTTPSPTNERIDLIEQVMAQTNLDRSAVEALAGRTLQDWEFAALQQLNEQDADEDADEDAEDVFDEVLDEVLEEIAQEAINDARAVEPTIGAENDVNDSLEDEQAEKAAELAINVRPISNDAFNTGGIVLGADLVDVFDDVPRGVQVNAEGRQQQRQSVLQMERNDVILAANDDNAAITRPPTRSAIRSSFRTAAAADHIRRGVLEGAYEGQYVNLTTVPRNSLITVPETAINADNNQVFLTPWEYEMLFNDQTGALPSINTANYLMPVTIAQLDAGLVRYTARNLLELGIFYIGDTDLEEQPANAVFDVTRTDILSFLEEYQNVLETRRERPKRAEKRPSILNTVSAVIRGEEPLFVLPTTGGAGGLDGGPFPVFLPRDLDQQVRDAFIGQTNRDDRPDKSGEELLDDGPGDDDPTASLTNPHREPEVIGPDIFDAVMDEDNPFLNVVLSGTAAVGAIAVQYAFDAPKRAVDVQPSGFGGGGGDDGDFDPKKVGSSGFRRPVDRPVPNKPSTPPVEGLNNAQKLALGGAAVGAGAVAGSKLLTFAKTIGSILILPATVAAGAYAVSYAARQARNEAE